MSNKYDNYKDSGIDWIGEIPSHWEVILFKRIIHKIKDGTHGSFQRVSEGKPFLSAKNVYDDGLRISETESFISEEDYFSIVKNGFPTKGDLLITCVGTIGRTFVYDFDEFLAFQRSVTFIRFNEDIIPQFYKYYVQSSIFQNLLMSIAKTSAQSGIYMGDLVNTITLKVPTIEQTVIANYLDHKTSQIDHLIAKKEQFIKLLEEERVAVINQAVTKGLDPNVPMKDSGVEWLGEIPEHWEVKKLKYLLKENKDALKTGPFGSHIKNSDYITNGEYKVYTQRNVLDNEYENGCESITVEKFSELKGFSIFEGDILITTRGSIGRCSVFPEGLPLGILHPCLIRVQINEKLSLKNWIVNYINNTSLFYNNVKYNSNSTIIDVIYGYTLKEIFFPVPTINEQIEILNYLELKTGEIEILISKSKQEIELLKEYKTALISEVVTGKVDVRNKKLN